MGLRVHAKTSYLSFNAGNALCSFMLAGFHTVIGRVLIAEGLHQVLIEVVEVGFENFGNVVQLAIDTIG